MSESTEYKAPLSYEQLAQQTFGEIWHSPNTWPASSFSSSSLWGTAVSNRMFEVELDLAKHLLEEIHSSGVPGAVVEFGVFEGRWLGHLIKHADSIGMHREYFGFDSFEGLPEPGPADEGLGWTKGLYSAGLDLVASRLDCANRPNVHLIKGWFCDSLPTKEAQAIGNIAYARVDGDLYESAVDCLQFLTGRLSDGAILVFDDWTFHTEKGETRAFFEWAPESGYIFEPIGFIGIGSFYFRIRLKPETD